MIWDLGDRVPLRHKVYNDAGQLTAATVTLTVTDPDGATTTPAVTTTTAGVYDVRVPVTVAGTWVYAWTVTGTIPDDVVPGWFQAGDPAPPLYVPLDAFRGSLDKADTDTARDGYLLMCLEAASRGVEDHCGGRQFWRDRTATARTFRTRGRVDTSDSDGELLLVDDIAAATGLLVEARTGTGPWTTVTDVDLEPDNALARRRPVTGLRRFGGRWSQHRQVRVTAVWGWPVVPAGVVQATQIQAARLAKRRTSPEGISGNAEWGPVRLSRIDPDVQELLRDYVLITIG